MHPYFPAMSTKSIETALISVFYKDGLEPLLSYLNSHNVRILSTGGTLDFIKNAGYEAEAVEDLTGYPSILGGRVKTLHPKVFGGILGRSGVSTDQEEREQYEIPAIDLVVVDLYPFEETVSSGASEADIIEKIDIGGVSLIRAAAKNFNDVLIVSDRSQYEQVVEVLGDNCQSTIEERKQFSAAAFDITSHYDTAIYTYFGGGSGGSLKVSERKKQELRYGENPHQQGSFYGSFDDAFHQLHGKAISYNNLLDIDSAVSLVQEFEETVFAIIKHTNACGLAAAESVSEAYSHALASDPVSAFGGILCCNREIDSATADEINKLFFEVLIAPSFEASALEVLKSKKNRILLVQKQQVGQPVQLRSVLGGVLVQDSDSVTESDKELKTVTDRSPEADEIRAMILANKVVKHTKSNAIVLATTDRLLSSGVGQTSRVDALKQAIEKAEKFELDLKGAVMASDAFFPFPDCVEIAHGAGIKAVIQPGGSVKDQLSIDYCNEHGIAMVFSGHRHFKH